MYWRCIFHLHSGQRKGSSTKAVHRFSPIFDPLHIVPESLHSSRFRFSRISVFCNKKFKKIREIAEFIPYQLHFNEKKTLANFREMEISLVVLPCHFIG